VLYFENIAFSGHVCIVINQGGIHSIHTLHLSYDPHPVIEEFGTLF
jgi:hypothetical protein